MATQFRLAMTDKLKEIVNEYGLQSPIVDIGNSNKEWLQSIIDTDEFQALDLRNGFNLCRHNRQVQSNSFGSIFSICVLEHVENPFTAAKEMYRILKKDGIIYVTVPFVYPVHNAPGDYWRFTEQGISTVFCDYYIFESGYFDNGNGVYLVGTK